MNFEPGSPGLRTQDAGPRRAQRGALVLTLLLALCSAFGCSKKAIIHRNDGGMSAGIITRSDVASVYVETRSRGEIAIPRETIERIDHPGGELVVIGAPIAVGGLVLGAGGILVGKYADGLDNILTGFVLMVPIGSIALLAGTVVALGGLSINGRSVSAAAPPDDASAEADLEKMDAGLPLEAGGWRPGTAIRFLGIAPLMDPDRELNGLTLGFQF